MQVFRHASSPVLSRNRNLIGVIFHTIIKNPLPLFYKVTGDFSLLILTNNQTAIYTARNILLTSSQRSPPVLPRGVQ